MFVTRHNHVGVSLLWLGLLLFSFGCEPIGDITPQDSAPPGDSNAQTVTPAVEDDEEEDAYFDLGGEIALVVKLDPLHPTSTEPTHVIAEYSSAYGRPKVQLEMRVVTAGGEPTAWQSLKMTGGHVYDEATDDIVPVKDLDQEAPSLEYGDSIYETDFQFPAGKMNIEFREKDGESLRIQWPISVK
ncbi:hypothetical protein Pan97_02900 [Bremerella volcania]|uniref:Uncharacterized protein n=1 Tax=Bremerella volcania TaxID=2527984 RepID=A0A518C263_9BACT|nr:hypothetical protein [Bremerella volcania]QDU73321.1 hypothetical protein Pan97_02900 [Bremerella volcania]